MQEPIGVTQNVPPTADAMPVRNDPTSDNDAFIVDTPYLLSDGNSREAPIPVVVVDGASWRDRAGNIRDVMPLNITGFVPGLELPLNNGSAIAQNITINSISPTGGSFTTNTGGVSPRRTYTLAIPPAATQISFNITTAADLFFRIGDTVDLGPSVGSINELYPMMAAGTYSVTATVPPYTTRTRLGFFSAIGGFTFTISNWRVNLP